MLQKCFVDFQLFRSSSSEVVAGQKLSEKLIGPPYELLSTYPTEVAKSNKPTEPTKTKVKSKKKKRPEAKKKPSQVPADLF
jgi:hypothetical protein